MTVESNSKLLVTSGGAGVGLHSVIVSGTNCHVSAGCNSVAVVGIDLEFVEREFSTSSIDAIKLIIVKNLHRVVRRGIAVAGRYSLAAAGTQGMATVGDFGFARAGRYGTAVAGIGGYVCGDSHCDLNISYYDIESNQVLRARTMTGVAAKPNTWYTLDENNEFVEADVDIATVLGLNAV